MYYFAIACLLIFLANAAVANDSRDVKLDRDWKFLRVDAADAAPVSPEAADFPDDAWETVALPHTPRIEPLMVQNVFQGICWYRRKIAADPSWKGKKVYLEFQAGMQQTEVWINGAHALSHDGGYLPFTVNLTSALAQGAAEVAVRLDNSDNPDIPPGQKSGSLDFNYAGGLYRNAILHVVDPLHITDAVAADEVAGGGVFVRYEDVSAESARVVVQANVINEGDKEATAQVLFTLLDAGGNPVAAGKTAEQVIAAGKDGDFAETLTLSHPKLWSPSHPNLYTLRVGVARSSGATTDAVSLRIGIRTLRNDPHLGLFLNGESLAPFGANRHNQYPFVGNAIPDNAQYRDAVKLKEAGWSLIRLCHYPQSPAFLDACDELGLMVIVCLPGWQHFSDTDRFKNDALRDARQVVRRDRNHPCAVLWEASLNETAKEPDAFVNQTIDALREEYPGGQLLTCGDTQGRHQPKSLHYDVPYTGWNNGARPSLVGDDIKGLHREFGDNEVGSSRVARRDGERAMQEQAWAYQTCYNRELGYPWTWGGCIWEGFDNVRGASANTATCGAWDLLRLPKFMYLFWKSQRDPDALDPRYESGPFIAFGNYWQPDFEAGKPVATKNVIVYSNCDEVELRVNGQSLARRHPDAGPTRAVHDPANFNLAYWQQNPGGPMQEEAPNPKPFSAPPIYWGGNCDRLPHPPFTFSEVPFAPGEVEAIGYRKGARVASALLQTPGDPAKLTVSFDTAGRALAADGSDILFVRARVEDASGNLVPWVGSNKGGPDNRGRPLQITFAVSGPARLIGPDSVAAEEGYAVTLIQSIGAAGDVSVTASADGLTQGIGSTVAAAVP